MLRSTPRQLRVLAWSLALALSGFLSSGPAAAHHRASTTNILLRATTLQGVLNINAATVDQWQMLPGIGPATAAKIVAYREKRSFRSLSHVMRVKGIGSKTFAEIRPFLTLDGPTTLRVTNH